MLSVAGEKGKGAGNLRFEIGTIAKREEDYLDKLEIAMEHAIERYQAACAVIVARQLRGESFETDKENQFQVRRNNLRLVPRRERGKRKRESRVGVG